MSNGFDTIIYTKQENIAQIKLNRPDVLNSHNMQMRDDLYSVLEACEEDPDVKSIVLTGEGQRAFCTGADLTEFGTAPSRIIARQVRWERDLWGLLNNLNKPIIAGLHGYVLGSGMEMALLCDIRIASEDAIFGMPEAGLGMIPVAGGTQIIPRTIGIPKTFELLFSGNRIDSEEAFAIGLVHKVVPNNLVMKEALRLARELSGFNANFTAAIKTNIRISHDLPVMEGIDSERKVSTNALLASK